MHSATQFLSTPSARRATHQTGGRLCSKSISIHALREEGDVDSSSNVYGWVDISIHALREEGDFASMRCAVRASNFYPRPPRGGRLWAALAMSSSAAFLSTPSARRATQRVFLLCQQLCISIHALREEGDLLREQAADRRPISIHALREEGDSKNRDKISIFKQIIQHSARI